MEEKLEFLLPIFLGSKMKANQNFVLIAISSVGDDSCPVKLKTDLKTQNLEILKAFIIKLERRLLFNSMRSNSKAKIVFSFS